MGFIPGQSERPPAASESEPIDRPADEWRWDDDYLFGVDLYAAGFAWEAHEAWEGAWRVAAEPARKALLQGLIQCAAAVVKAMAGSARGAQTLSARAAGHLERASDLAGSPFMGLDVGRFVRELRAWGASPAPSAQNRPAIALEERSRDLLASLTDLRVRPAATYVEEGADYAILRTPNRPDFRDGNFLLLDRPLAADELEDRLRDVGHAVGFHPRRPLSLCWETMMGAPPRDVDGVDALAVFATTRAPVDDAPPTGVELRPLERADREAVVAVAIEDLPQGDAALADLIRWRMLALERTLHESGGRLWGAFRGERLIGSLGLYESPTLLRFQEVMTRAVERGRGVATSLIARALTTALSRNPRARAIIVAEPGGPAERIYRRLGFDRVGTQYWLHRSLANAAPG